MKEVFIAVVTSLATLFAVYYGSQLSQSYSQDKEYKQTVKSTLIDIVSKAEIRVHRLQNVVWSSGSKRVFHKRWDSYIETGLVPWDSSYFRMKVSINNFAENKETVELFEDLHLSFESLHAKVEDEIFSKINNSQSLDKKAKKELNIELGELKRKSNHFAFLVLYELEDNPISFEHFGEFRN